MQAVCSEHSVEYNKWGQCPDCKRKANKRYGATEKGKKSRRKYQKKYMATEMGRSTSRKYNNSPKRKAANCDRLRKERATPEGKLKVIARNAVRCAIRKGELKRLPCLVCGNPKSEAHHIFGYSKEHRLNVVFLCRAHHVVADKELKSKAPVV